MEKKQLIELVKKASSGDDLAFNELYELKFRSILYNAYNFLHNHHDAEDAAQEIVTDMYRKIGKLSNPEYFNIWLQKITSNHCIDVLRKKGKIKEDFDLDNGIDPEKREVFMEVNREFLPQAFIEDADLRSQLLEIVDELPKKRKRAIYLYYYEELTQPEIAQVMGISQSTVASNIMRAKRDIRNKVEERMNGQVDFNKISTKQVATAPVMAQVFQKDAVDKFPADRVADLMGFNYKAGVHTGSFVKGIGLQTIVKVSSAIVVATIITTAVFVLTVKPNMTQEQTKIPVTTQNNDNENSANSLYTGESKILFSGNSSGAEHINPESANIEYTGDEKVDYTWDILDKTTGKSMLHGSGKSVKKELTMLEVEQKYGEYILQFTLADEETNKLLVRREFEVVQQNTQ